MSKTTLREVFDEIASSWYNFRHWTRFRRELEALAKRWGGGKLLNIGCGHGADFLPFKGGFELYGIDFSTEMLKLALKYAQKFSFSANLFLSEASHLPFADESFDWAISIATYHHLSDARARKRAFLELERVLKPEGEAFITVWNRWHPRFWFKDKEILLPWKTKNKTLYRYHYLFSYFELKKLLEEAGFEVVNFPFGSSQRLFSRNILLLARKKR